MMRVVYEIEGQHEKMAVVSLGKSGSGVCVYINGVAVLDIKNGYVNRYVCTELAKQGLAECNDCGYIKTATEGQ